AALRRPVTTWGRLPPPRRGPPQPSRSGRPAEHRDVHVRIQLPDLHRGDLAWEGLLWGAPPSSDRERAAVTCEEKSYCAQLRRTEDSQYSSGASRTGCCF